MGISIKKILLTELNFKRKPSYPANIKYSFGIEIGINHLKESDIAQVSLKISVTEDEEQSVTLDCSMLGVFHIEDKGDLPLSIDEFLHINAPAIIYPYIREIVSNTTIDAGLDPLYVPIYNFKAMYDKNKGTDLNGKESEK
jgi:preprotein translocase subunit SecB